MKFDKLCEVVKDDLPKKVATVLYNDYWNFHTRVLETLAEDNGEDWVDENSTKIFTEIDKLTYMYYKKLKKESGR